MTNFDRIIAIGDVHGDAQLSGYDYAPDILLRLNEVRTKVHQGDLVFQLGDLCDPDRGARTQRAISIFGDFAAQLPQGSYCYGIPGNHCRYDDARARSVWDAYEWHPRIGVFDRPELFSLRPGLLGLALPWLSRAHGEFDYPKIAEALLDDARKCKQRIIVFAHLDIAWATPGSEAGMARLGYQELPKCVEEDPIVELILCGHYHRRQTIGSKIEIVGSLECLGFGDRDVDHGVLEITL